MGNWDPILRRRSFLAAFAGSVTLAPQALHAFPCGKKGCRSDDPMACLRTDKWPTLVALADAHLHSLWRSCPEESACEVIRDVLRFVENLPLAAQQAICLSISGIEWFCLWKRRERFDQLSVRERTELLNQGERPYGCRGFQEPTITWEKDTSLHMGVSLLSTLIRLVVNSRLAARRLIGLRWSPQCMDLNNLAHMPPPPYPDLTQTYDVCVIGSGAGGAVVAARAAEAGLRVLIVEEGEWISPDGLVQRIPDEQGNLVAWPARDDEGLLRLFQGCGINLAGRLTDPELDNFSFDEHMKASGRKGITFLGRMLNKSKPMQAINLLQARVVGGGPYINNAIHLEIDPETWEKWGSQRPTGVDFDQLNERMQQVKSDLGVSGIASERYSGYRTQAFVEACQEAGVPVEPLPVSILGQPDQPGMNECAACGSDNIVDPFGQHIGGLHPVRENSPTSYLMRALQAGAQVAWQLRARQFQLVSSAEDDSCGRAAHLVCEDWRGLRPNQRGQCLHIRADRFVLAAGAIASTRIIARTERKNCIRVKGLGQAFTANVVTPVYAVYDQSICGPEGERAEPGVAQCYYVRRTFNEDGTEVDDPALENWFHYPGSVAIALTGWFSEYVNVMRKYDHLSICGMVVPTSPRPENRIDRSGKTHLRINREEFELLLRGIRKIGRIYLAAATPDNGVTIHLPTRAPILDACHRPIRIRSDATLDWALHQVRCRGPEFLSLATAHPQGGNALGTVVDPNSFRLQDASGRKVDNLYVADASLFPRGCEVNPQLTIKGLATFAADHVVEHQSKSTQAEAA